LCNKELLYFSGFYEKLLTDTQTNRQTDKQTNRQTSGKTEPHWRRYEENSNEETELGMKIHFNSKVRAGSVVETHSLRNTYVSGLTTRVKVKKIFTRCLKKKHDFAPQPQTTVSPTDA